MLHVLGSNLSPKTVMTKVFHRFCYTLEIDTGIVLNSAKTTCLSFPVHYSVSSYSLMPYGIRQMSVH
jgi:hypothetical protein